MEDLDVPKELVTEWRVEDDFISAVKSKGRVRPRPSFEDGVRYMRVVQAVADSRARKEWVAIKKCSGLQRSLESGRSVRSRDIPITDADPASVVLPLTFFPP